MSCDTSDRNCTGAQRLTVDQHRARTALLTSTAELAAVDVEILNQNTQKRFAQRSIGLNSLSIEFKSKQLKIPSIDQTLSGTRDPGDSDPAPTFAHHSMPNRLGGLMALRFLFHDAVELPAAHDLHLRILQGAGDGARGVDHHMLLTNNVFI